MLNEAVNKLERGDIVLMKTLIKLNYYERMNTKEKYEQKYESVRILFTFWQQWIAALLVFGFLKDLKKGLIKSLDKQFEPIINALLTNMDSFDAEKIYESLYVSSNLLVEFYFKIL